LDNDEIKIVKPDQNLKVLGKRKNND